MKKFSTALLFIVAVLALSWFLPWLYYVASPSASTEPFLYFSPVKNQWVITQKDSTDKFVHKLDDGTKLTLNEYDMLLPQKSYRDLMAKGIMPDSINGIAVDVPALRHAEMMLMTSTRDINKKYPDLYLIMESMPPRVDLQDPTEAFRADGKIEFINLKDNSINAKRSKLFTETFAARGFQYPIKWANAQITARKNYDEGYLLIDNAGSLYHFKQQAGRPYLAKIDTDTVKMDYAYILENMDKTERGIVISQSGDVYLLRQNGNGYGLEKFPVKAINPKTDRMMVWGNLFNRLVRVNAPEGTSWYALDTRTNELLGEKFYPAKQTTASKIAEYIFPFDLTFISNADSFAKPRLVNFSYLALPLNFILALLLFCLFRRQNTKCAAAAAVVTLFLGIYSFITFYFLKKS